MLLGTVALKFSSSLVQIQTGTSSLCFLHMFMNNGAAGFPDGLSDCSLYTGSQAISSCLGVPKDTAYIATLVGIALRRAPSHSLSLHRRIDSKKKKKKKNCGGQVYQREQGCFHHQCDEDLVGVGLYHCE
ncbi:hypothetical protein EV426DRAFT_289686 [Tirmania nivea]|nr:hypothetical protein EV426DRAFT_289686 [Tirmania nivea]